MLPVAVSYGKEKVGLACGSLTVVNEQGWGVETAKPDACTMMMTDSEANLHKLECGTCR